MSTESPIEEDMLGAFQSVGHTVEIIHKAKLEQMRDGAKPDVVLVGTQVPVGRYRLDFLLSTVRYGKTNLLCVECDGKAWHENWESVQRDMKRDEFLRGLGINVMRFTGSDIHRDMYRCARQAISEIAYVPDDLGEDTFKKALVGVVENAARRFMRGNP